MYLWQSLPYPLKLLLLGLLLIQFTGVIRVYAAYVEVPKIIYRTNVLEPLPEARVVDAALGDVIDPGLLTYIDSAERTLLGLGFTSLLRTTTGTGAPLLTTIGCTVEHPAGDLGSIVSIRSEGAKRLHHGVSFESHFEDGSELVTSNHGGIRLWPYDPRSDVVRFADVEDVAEVYRLHRLRVAAHGRHSRQKLLTRGATTADRLAYERREAREFYEHLVRCGYRWPSPGGLRPTRRGAAFTVWRRLFPWRHVAEWNERRLAAEVRRLG